VSAFAELKAMLPSAMPSDREIELDRLDLDKDLGWRVIINRIR